MLLRKAMKSVSVRNDNVNRFVKWNISKQGLNVKASHNNIYLLVLKGKLIISLTKENMSVIVKGLVEKG